MSELPADAPKPRLCHIIKWPDFDGYGFNLHADKTRPGQYIGKVDEKSPADVAGLKEGDRIIEVNGVNILNENHKQVVQRIKNIANETKLLVVDGETDRWYKEKDLVVRGDQSNIVFGTSIKSAVEPATTNGEIKKIDEDDSRSTNSAQSSHSEQSTQPQLQSPPNSAADRDEQQQQQQVEPVREIPVLVVDSDSSEEVTDSITDTYDNVIFSQEGERRDEDALESKEEVENKEMAASKIAVEDEAASALQRDCNEEIVGVKDCGNDAETKSEISIDLSSERSSSIHHDEDRPDSSIKSSLDEEPTPEPIPEPVHLVEKEDESEKKSLVEESIESSASSTPSPPPPAEPEIPTFIPEVVAITVPPPKVTSTATATATTDKTKSSMKNGGLNLNMTVAEMRAQLAAKKKFDPRKDTIDLKKKYQIIQNM